MKFELINCESENYPDNFQLIIPAKEFRKAKDDEQEYRNLEQLIDMFTMADSFYYDFDREEYNIILQYLKGNSAVILVNEEDPESRDLCLRFYIKK